jgi:hypothetical protein
VVSEFQWFPNSSGFQIPVVSRRPLDLGNHWKLETTGTWNPLESGNHWNLKTTGNCFRFAIPAEADWGFEALRLRGLEA